MTYFVTKEIKSNGGAKTALVGRMFYLCRVRSLYLSNYSVRSYTGGFMTELFVMILTMIIGYMVRMVIEMIQLIILLSDPVFLFLERNFS